MEEEDEMLYTKMRTHAIMELHIDMSHFAGKPKITDQEKANQWMSSAIFTQKAGFIDL
jgi:hypothetical protein